jgi:hypothetical protein
VADFVRVDPTIWCWTCHSWRYTRPCGRDDCPEALSPSVGEAPNADAVRLSPDVSSSVVLSEGRKVTDLARCVGLRVIHHRSHRRETRVFNRQ